LNTQGIASNHSSAFAILSTNLVDISSTVFKPQETIPLSFKNSHTVFHCCLAKSDCSFFVILFIFVSILFATVSAESEIDLLAHHTTFFTHFIVAFAHCCINGTATGKTPHIVAHNATFQGVVLPCCATSNIACSAQPTNAPCATPFAIVGRLRAAIHALAV
jgi:hypothetical protein